MLDLEMLNLGSNYTVKYDAWNRLSTVADGGTVIQTNRYDGLHRRVSRESNTTGVRHFYWNEEWQCVEERTGTSTTADRQFVWHPYYIDALAISYNSSGTAHYYVQDGNFNVTAAMDSSGSVVERYSYTPYGECIVLNADFTLDSSSGGDGLSDIFNEFTYTGRRLDVETGLYQYRHRYYHAQLGRFVNRDPIGYEGSPWNLYGYADCKAVDLVDPTGNAGIAEKATWRQLLGKNLDRHKTRYYYPTTGMSSLIGRMYLATSLINSFVQGGTSAIASYRRYNRRINYSAATLAQVAPEIALHETVHVLNHQAGRYAYDAETDEADAYGVQAIFSHHYGLAKFDDDFLTYSQEELASNWWDLWDMTKVTSYPRYLLNIEPGWKDFFGYEHQRFMTNDDYLRITADFGLKMSCSAMAEIYAEQYTTFNGGCAVLLCPSNLPTAFQ